MQSANSPHSVNDEQTFDVACSFPYVLEELEVATLGLFDCHDIL
jgi:hypothetical protein